MEDGAEVLAKAQYQLTLTYEEFLLTAAKDSYDKHLEKSRKKLRAIIFKATGEFSPACLMICELVEGIKDGSFDYLTNIMRRFLILFWVKTHIALSWC